MRKTILILLIVFGFIIFTEDIFGQQIYKSVDEKGTVNFTDNPTSSVITTQRGAAKQDGGEVLKRNEVANRPSKTDSDIKAVLQTMPTWRGSASSGGSSGTVRRGTS
jgi:hypothetical protein